MGKLLPIWLYSALGSLTLVGVVAPQQPVSAPIQSEAPKGAASEAAPPPPLAFDAITPAVFDRQEDGNPTTFVILKNDGPAVQVAEFSAVLLNRRGQEVAVTVDPAQATVPPGRPTVVPLRLIAGATAGRGASADEFWRARLPLRGFLVLQTVRAKEPPPSVTRELLVAPPQPAPQVDTLVIASLLAALLIVATGTWWAGVGKVKRKMGSPSWDESWGSNLTLGAGLLMAFLNLAVFPEHTRYLPKSSYSLLSVVFASLVGLSPAIYGLLRMPGAQAGSAAQPRGYVGFFCVAAVFTLWGATGQVATLVVAVFELRASLGFPPLLALLMLVLSIGLLVLLLIYGVVSVRNVITQVPLAQAPAGGKATSMSGALPPAPDSGWQLL